MSDIVNVGICTVDAIGQTISDYPPPGGLRLFEKLTLTTGGNAMNCSIALAKMGVPCDVIVKVVNTSAGPVQTDLALSGVNVSGKGAATVLTSESAADENSLDNPTRVSPKTEAVNFSGNTLTRAFSGNSLTVLRLKTK